MLAESGEAWIENLVWLIIIILQWLTIIRNWFWYALVPNKRNKKQNKGNRTYFIHNLNIQLTYSKIDMCSSLHNSIIIIYFSNCFVLFRLWWSKSILTHFCHWMSFFVFVFTFLKLVKLSEFKIIIINITYWYWYVQWRALHWLIVLSLWYQYLFVCSSIQYNVALNQSPMMCCSKNL